MDKVYNHKDHEEDIYKLWEKSGSFSPNDNKEAFTIVMPPPNANENLHIGHARFITIEDILTRYYRMKGLSTLWLPGADHAGIETQYVFEKKLQKEGKSRFDYDRDVLYKMIWDYVQMNRSNMENQLRALGASCDWTRNKFTLDPDIIKIVYKTFKHLYDDGLIYRGERMVNYCPRCGTAFSELEVFHIERNDDIYYLDYGPITIATTRPETIFADVAIAVHPKDKRYKKLIGKKAIIPIINREIPIIADTLVDMEYATGALKITPAHDPTDFEIGQKHKLQTISVIDENGRMTNTPPKYIGMKVVNAKKAVIDDLIESGKLIKTENITHTVGVCYRDKGLIEPTISNQWFINVKPLAKEALSAIKTKKVKFAVKKYEKFATHWLKNLKDWNISRQIVWGIRIPAWRCDKCLEWTITDGDTPTECKSCGHEKLSQDADTFDTWFSSGQWPFATLESNSRKDLDKFYPTSIMETAYDIIPFWVIRMIMLGLYEKKNIPFREVLIHGLVRDALGEKISKSKGNVIDPLEMSDKYGSDAVRMGLIWGALIENDISLSEQNIKGQRNFANKLWNVSRYILSNQGKSNKSKLNESDKQIKKELRQTIKKVNKLIEKRRLNEAAEELYDFVWNKFANTYLESTKNRRDESQKTLEFVLGETLKLLHPFMPFITETLWQMNYGDKNNLLITQDWPEAKTQ